MPADPWRLIVATSAARSIAVRLPEGVAAAVVEFITGPLLECPRRVGHELVVDLFGTWSARRGAYRVLHEIDDEQRTVKVIRVDHSADVYRPR